MCTARIFRFKRWPIICSARRKTILCTIYQSRVAVTWHAEKGELGLRIVHSRRLFEWKSRDVCQWAHVSPGTLADAPGRNDDFVMRFIVSTKFFVCSFFLSPFRQQTGTTTTTIQRPDDKYARPAESRYGSSYPMPGSSVISDSVAGRFRCPSNIMWRHHVRFRLAPFVRVAGIHTVTTRKQDVHNCLF